MQISHDIWLESYRSNYPLAVEEFLHIAVAIAEAVHALHRKNELIGVLTPANIKLTLQPYTAQITELMSWNNAYKAPEHDNKLRISPGQQSDLYSLGIIYYEMLTGVLPYEISAEHRDWLYHHHILSPRSLIELRSDIPEILERIILKLMSKSPRDRYASAYGLLDDLKKCLRDEKCSTGIQSFELGVGDTKQFFDISKIFIGRNEQLAKLLHSFEQISTNKTKNVLVNIYGESGTGKTELVRQFLKRISTDVLIIGTSLESKALEESFIVAALRNGFAQLWYQDKKKILNMKDKIERECGEYISYMWRLFPVESRRLALYRQDIITEPLDQERLHHVLLVILKSFSSLQIPIIIAIDDLHLADVLTHNIMRSLIFEKNLPNTIIIGITAEQKIPYTGQIVQQSQSSLIENERILILQLSHFSYEDVRTYLSKIVHEDTKPLRLLARIAYDASKGNPMQLKELVVQWAESNKLFFNYNRGVWIWEEIAEDKSYHLPSDSLYLYKEAYERLNDRVKTLLHIASVIGIKFSIDVLSVICEEQASTLSSLLAQAEQEGIIVQEEYRTSEHEDIEYLFMHTQLQLGLYEQFQSESEGWHYKIGCYYWRNYNAHQRIEDSIGAAKHWNRALQYLSLKEQEALLQFNVMNAKHYNWVRKHHEAISAAEAGILLSDTMNISFEQKFDYYLAAAIGEHMLGNINKSSAYLKSLMGQYDKFTPQERILLLIKQLEIYTYVDNDEAYRIGKVGLNEVGWSIPEKVSVAAMLKEVIKTQQLLRKFRKHNIVPSINNEEEYIVFNEILVAIMIPTLNADPIKMVYILARYMQYCLNKGITELFVVSLAIYELIVQRELKFINKWLPTNMFPIFEQVLVDHGLQSYRIPVVYGLYHLVDDPKLSVTYWMRVIRRAIEHKDIVVANTSMTFLLSSYYGNINDLKEIHQYLDGEASNYIDEKNNEILVISKRYSQVLNDEVMARAFIAESSTNDNHPWYMLMCSYKAEVSYLLGEYKQALQWAERALNKVDSYEFIHKYRLELFKGLALAASYRLANDAEKKKIRLHVKKLVAIMNEWTGLLGKQSSAHQLVQAEYYRLVGKNEQAVACYEASVKQAQNEGYHLIEGIAGERLFDNMQAYSNQEQATVLLVDACSAYASWGIAAKMDWLRNKYPHIYWYYSQQSGQHIMQEEQDDDKEHAANNKAEAAPKQAIVQDNAHSTVTKENDMWELIGDSFNTTRPYGLNAFLELVVKQLGGTRIFLIDVKGSNYSIELTAGRPIAYQFMGVIPLAIIRYVLNTEQPYIIDDAVENLMLSDDYVQLYKPRAIICMPFGKVRNGNRKLLYMENNEIPSQFTERTVQLLELFITRYIYLNWLNEKELQEQEQARLEQGEQSLLSERGLRYGLVEPLTQREQEILIYIHEGFSNKEIAKALQISEATVKTHNTNLYSKLGVKRRSQAILKAKELNIISPKS